MFSLNALRYLFYTFSGNIGKESYILTGAGLNESGGDSEVQKIHQENVEKLSSMSHEEIMIEREKLLAALGKFIKACISP